MKIKRRQIDFLDHSGTYKTKNRAVDRQWCGIKKLFIAMGAVGSLDLYTIKKILFAKEKNMFVLRSCYFIKKVVPKI